MKANIWLVTKNNPIVSTDEYLEKFYTEAKASYVCGQLEKGANGTPHI